MEMSSVQALPQDQLERFQGLRSSELQTSALVALNEYEEKAREYQEKLRELREHYIPEVKSIYNSGALINQLPNELIIHIFHFVGPRTSPADAIRLTHICRLWRLLIHQAPTFWSDLLDAEDVLARTWHDNAMVLSAFDRSEPVTQIGFSMYGSFLPLLETVPVHASRISTLWLDAAVIEEQDVRPFFRLHMPHLEELTIWMWCSNKANSLIEPQSGTRFPKLRHLQTNCVQFSIAWISSTIRTLWLGTSRIGDEGDCYPEVCCQLRFVDQLLQVLAKCPNLTELVFDGCLPRTPAIFGPCPTVYLPNLEVLDLRGAPSVLSSVATHLVMPDSTEIALTSDTAPYYALSELLPESGSISLSSVNHLSIELGRRLHYSNYEYSVWGGADDTGEYRLGLCSFAALPPRANSNNTALGFDLLRFFQGFVPVFSPSSVTSLKITSFGSFHDSLSGGFTYIFQHYPQLTHLSLRISFFQTVFKALAGDGVLARLQRLEVCIDINCQDAALHETMVSMLEARTFRGLQLKSFLFSTDREDEEGFHFNDKELLPPMTDDLVRRLASIIPDVVIEHPDAPWPAPDPAENTSTA